MKTKVSCEKMLVSPLGPLRLGFSSQGLVRLDFLEPGDFPPERDLESQPGWVQETLQALAAYFDGVAPAFEALPLDLEGTPFQLRVWQELRVLPWGCTITYQELAARLGKPRACRAVGQALKANPVAIVIPCHRVIAKDGSLGGYRAGADRKRWLLSHERQTFR